MKNMYQTMLESEAESLLYKADNIPIVLTFAASWKGNSQILDDFYNELAPKFNAVRFIRIDADQANNLTTKFGVQTIPTSLFIKEKDIVDYFEGVLPKEEIENRLQKLCNNDLDLRFVLLD